MTAAQIESDARGRLARLAAETGLDVAGGRLRRTSSRFCFGVEHGDYNGTELFGVGTDRFIWMAYKANDSGGLRLCSANFPGDGIVSFRLGETPPPRTVTDSWARFPYGVDHVLRREGLALKRGFDAVLYGNIPGGGMSRSASLTLNLILTALEVNRIKDVEPMRVADLAQAVENDYIGSPCGKLDQIMILFAKAGKGTHYKPADRSVQYVPLGGNAPDFRIVCLDTGTVRPGLEKSTYRIRRAECDELAALAGAEFGFKQLADIHDESLYGKVIGRFERSHPDHCDRLAYIFSAQRRFRHLLEAWQGGDIAAVGRIFRADGIGLRDQYKISGPELETMCDIARTVPGVLGERMLGGGDKGAAGALAAPKAVAALRRAVATAYPRSHPEFADKCAVHECRVVDGVKVSKFEG